MARLRMCMILLFVAGILPFRASSVFVPGSKLDCGPNNTVEAAAGHNLTLHCSINLSAVKKKCDVERYMWRVKSTGKTICEQKNGIKEDTRNTTEKQTYTCGWDKTMQMLYLDISRLEEVKEEIYKISVQTSDCGPIYSEVTVLVINLDKVRGQDKAGPVTSLHLVAIIGALAFVGGLAFLVTTQRGRKFMSRVWHMIVGQTNTEAEAEPRSEASEPLRNV